MAEVDVQACLASLFKAYGVEEGLLGIPGLLSLLEDCPEVDMSERRTLELLQLSRGPGIAGALTFVQFLDFVSALATYRYPSLPPEDAFTYLVADHLMQMQRGGGGRQGTPEASAGSTPAAAPPVVDEVPPPPPPPVDHSADADLSTGSVASTIADQHVRKLLFELRLFQFAGPVSALGVETLEDLQHINTSDLEQLGMTLVQARRFLRAAGQQSPAAVLPPPVVQAPVPPAVPQSPPRRGRSPTRRSTSPTRRSKSPKRAVTALVEEPPYRQVWVEYATPEGYLYYSCENTGETRWEPPVEDAGNVVVRMSGGADGSDSDSMEHTTPAVVHGQGAAMFFGGSPSGSQSSRKSRKSKGKKPKKKKGVRVSTVAAAASVTRAFTKEALEESRAAWAAMGILSPDEPADKRRASPLQDSTLADTSDLPDDLPLDGVTPETKAILAASRATTRRSKYAVEQRAVDLGAIKAMQAGVEHSQARITVATMPGGGAAGRSHSLFGQSLRQDLYKAQPVAKPSRGGYAAAHKAASRKAGNVYDRLTDVTLYTGSHKARFDQSGRGKGLAGRDDGYDTTVGPGEVVVTPYVRPAPGTGSTARGTGYTRS